MDFEAIGTRWKITPALDHAVQVQVTARIEAFDKTYSRFREDSTIASLTKKPGSVTLPEDSQYLFQLYRTFYELTRGKMTPLVGDQLVAAGYDSEYSFRPKELPKIHEWDEAISYKDFTLTVKNPTVLDFGAIGKGYLVDIIAKLLDEAGAVQYVINAGGDIIQKGRGSQVVYLESPEDPEIAIGEIQIRNKAICGSGTRQRNWGAFHHVIDPSLKKSVDEVQATWVIADTAAVADGIATALFFVSPDVVRKHFSFDYVILEQGNLRTSLSAQQLTLYIGKN